MAAGMPTITKVQLAWASGQKPSNGGGGGGNGGGESKEGKEESAYRKNTQKNQKSFIRNQLGIQLTSAAILKQSQIFTGFIGTIFQLIGALVDVILAPFLPVVIPAVKMLASFIPIISGFAQKIFDVLDWGLSWLGGLFGGLAGQIGNAIIPALTAFFLTGFIAKFFGMWGPFWAVSKAFFNLAGRIFRLVLNQFYKLLPMITQVWTKIIAGLVTLGDKIVGPIKTISSKLSNFFNPIKKPIIDLATKLGSKFLGALGTVIGTLWTKFKNLFPEGWIDNIGAAVAKYAKSGIKKIGGMFGNVAAKVAGRAAGLATAAPVTGAVGGVDLGDFSKFVTKNPSTLGKLAKAVPVLSTLVTAGMAIHRTAGAAAAGDWDRAGAYAAAGVAFTGGQILADLSSVTGVGLAASGALAVGEMVALNEIDKATGHNQPTNQDQIGTEYQRQSGTADSDPANRGGGF